MVAHWKPLCLRQPFAIRMACGSKHSFLIISRAFDKFVITCNTWRVSYTERLTSYDLLPHISKWILIRHYYSCTLEITTLTFEQKVGKLGFAPVWWTVMALFHLHEITLLVCKFDIMETPICIILILWMYSQITIIARQSALLWWINHYLSHVWYTHI